MTDPYTPNNAIEDLTAIMAAIKRLHRFRGRVSVNYWKATISASTPAAHCSFIMSVRDDDDMLTLAALAQAMSALTAPTQRDTVTQKERAE